MDASLTTITPTSGTSYTVDMTLPYQTISTTAQIDFTATSNRPGASAVRSCVVQIESYGGGSRNLTFNANWVFIGASAPTLLAASKVGLLSFMAVGTAETDIRVCWAQQP
jgi:hypothetical protein